MCRWPSGPLLYFSAIRRNLLVGPTVGVAGAPEALRPISNPSVCTPAYLVPGQPLVSNSISREYRLDPKSFSAFAHDGLIGWDGSMSPSPRRIAGHPRGSSRAAQMSVRHPSVPVRRPRDRRSAPRSDARPRRDWSQMLTTLIALGALVFTGVSVWQTGRQNGQQNNLTLQGQITDRYTAAVDQIGSTTLDVRLGGIYALERIMHDSPPDQRTIVQVLSAFVRDHPPGFSPPPAAASAAKPPPTDVVAALTVLSQRNMADVNSDLADLSNTNFAGVNLVGLQLTLRGADLEDSNFTHAELAGEDFTHSDLSGADLSGADLTDADLSDSIIDNVDLKGANLAGADLRSQSLDPAELAGADLTGAALDGPPFCNGSKPSNPTLHYVCNGPPVP